MIGNQRIFVVDYGQEGINKFFFLLSPLNARDCCGEKICLEMKTPKRKSPKKSPGKATQVASLTIRPVTKPVDEITAVSDVPAAPDKTYATTAEEHVKEV